MRDNYPQPLPPSIIRKFAVPVLLCLSTTLEAQDESISAEYFFTDLPVVLSATRLSQPLDETPGAMTVITREMIEASGAMNVPDVLRLVPGFTVGFYSGTRATASYHGLADQWARDMQVLLDGRSIYNPAFGGVSWPDMPIDMSEIERIEVFRGPNAAAYGSNSFAGVINIITENPADSEGVRVKMLVGESDTRQMTARYAKTSDKLAYSISASYQENSGFDSIPDSEDSQWVKFHGDYMADENDTLHFMFGGSKGNYDEGFEALAGPDGIRHLENRHHFEQLQWNHRASQKNEIDVQFYHNYFETDDVFRSQPLSQMILGFDSFWADLASTGIPIPSGDADRLNLVAQLLSAGLVPPSATNPFGSAYLTYDEMLAAFNTGDVPLVGSKLGFKSHRYDLELQQTLAPDDDLRVVWGAGLRRDSAEGLIIFHGDDVITRDQVRLFGNLEWHLTEKLVSNIGGMIEDFERKDPFFSPRLGLNYHADQNNTFRVNASRAYRMPTLYEDFVYNAIALDVPLNDLDNRTIALDNLDPQKIDNYELGYFGNFAKQGLALDLKLYREHISKIIDEYRDFSYPDPTRGLTGNALATLINFTNAMHQGIFSFTNFAEATIKGVELNLQYKPTPADLIFFGYSYMDADGKSLRNIDINGVMNLEPENLGKFIPDHTFSILASHRFAGGLQLSSAYYFTDDMFWWGDGDIVPSYRRWDLRVAQSFKAWGLDGEVSILGQNLNDENIDFYNGGSTERVNIWEPRLFLQLVLNY